ncbi:AfsR/SARP family transcriptional regulator [Aeromicrobium wangtongii]|uniref:AfsR/SARP family transcriptional regulator n=1 Tax=Aeromicrobium wangtongii TaxID=2969247 RepID=UPI002016D930|nr:BTAD domain-containing putative transcriptional regulator [Aeromicrobium wangtongii]MCL3817840.1 winged helix-turn-helix domain-containing protein [Aeromicrobium wangtongii]
MHDRIEIRMFGRFFVRRSNGDVVEADEWSTGKTTDLLRLLALNNNRTVSVHSIIDKLWPDVEEDKARASLRTAVSRVRHVLDEPCIERHLGGLVLRNAWADVTAFQSAAHDLSAALHAGDHARVVSLARETEALYIADFRAYDDKSFWATQTRDSLLISRQSILADAGESALKLQWMRDAIDFSTLAIAEDPCFERPHRTLMQAHLALGETELALRAFEHLRVCLSQELGADPSPQSRALHIQLLSSEPAADTGSRPFIGDSASVSSLAADIRAAIAGDGCDVVCLTGPNGSGRGALLDAAVATVEHAHLRHLIDDGPRTSAAHRLTRLASHRRSDITVWGPTDNDPATDADLLRTFFSGVDVAVPRVIVVITSDEAGDLLTAQLSDGPITVHRVSVGPLSDRGLVALATASLSCVPSPRLLAELAEQSDRLAGRAVSVLRDWISSGWIISTTSGVDLYNDPSAYAGAFPMGNYFRTILEQLSVAETELCQLLAVLDRPASGDLLREIAHADQDRPDRFGDIQASLDELSDLGVLRVGPGGYELRNRAVRDAFELRLRPAVKARLLRQVSSVPERGIAAQA